MRILRTVNMPQAYAKTMISFRRSAYAATLQHLLKQELEAAREQYEAQFGDVESKAFVAAIKRVQAVLFTAEVTV